MSNKTTNNKPTDSKSLLEKTYDPKSFESAWYERWEKAGSFACNPDSDDPPYTIMMPPPNVTGSLHIGHALTFTLQDILIRYHRMRGRDALWQPGTDHAGIATQMVVERMLDAEGLSRRDMGRDAFIKRVKQWKDESGGTITRQLRSLGASPDWKRERFTMDDGLSEAVRTAFVELHKQGLIYRDKRLVNWDPQLLTAISDLEVEQKEVKGHYWHLTYPIEGMEGETITVATTRPETMLGDTGVAVHPDDERYRHLVGKMARLPIVGRLIPIIADEHSDMEKGSGAVKMTPAHDFNDFEVGRRHGLEMINIFTAEARLNENTPEGWHGMDRFDARKRVVAEFEALGLLADITETLHTVPHGDRSGVTIEPWLMDQWYVNAEKLAVPAIEAVEKGWTRIIPQRWEKTYFEWMRNIQPWCISRQLWWGHRIPAWYGPDGQVFVAMDEGEAQAEAEAHYGAPTPLEQDEDVLDTWFSSGLWPFSTLGWPGEGKEAEEVAAQLKRYYPGDVLVTGFDIIFFWVARMMMLGMHFMGEGKVPPEGEGSSSGEASLERKVPFRDVYIHALVRDEKGHKMSKSKGNVMDPLELSEKYGADALRFTLTAMAAQGRDIKLAESRIAGYRNFATKIWNTCRFLEMNGCVDANTKRGNKDTLPTEYTYFLNKWIVAELVLTEKKVSAAVEEYRFNEAADSLYKFIWHSYCDWYLEFLKDQIANAESQNLEETKTTARLVMSYALRLLHPIMPFITEELREKVFEKQKQKMLIISYCLKLARWVMSHALRLLHPIMPLITEKLREKLFKKQEMLITSPWPKIPDVKHDEVTSAIDFSIALVRSIRSLRKEMNIPADAKPKIWLKDGEDLLKYSGNLSKDDEEDDEKDDEKKVEDARRELANRFNLILNLAGAKSLFVSNEMPSPSIAGVVRGVEFGLVLEGVTGFDFDAERARIKADIAASEKEMAKLEGKLANPGFLAKAPEEVIEKNRQRLADETKTRDSLTLALSRLND